MIKEHIDETLSLVPCSNVEVYEGGIIYAVFTRLTMPLKQQRPFCRAFLWKGVSSKLKLCAYIHTKIITKHGSNRCSGSSHSTPTWSKSRTLQPPMSQRNLHPNLPNIEAFGLNTTANALLTQATITVPTVQKF